jgi:hypothetical protein
MSNVFRLYGSSYQSVGFEFEAKALNEVGFRRDHEASIPADDLGSRYELLETVELVADAEGEVQNETEQLLLDRLREKAEEAIGRLPEGGIAVVENERGGRDQPKPRQKIGNVVERGENRLHFSYTVEPPLRIALYRPRG